MPSPAANLAAGRPDGFRYAMRCENGRDCPPPRPAGGGGPGNALTQRIAGRTEPGQVHKVKKWMVLAGYTHGMQHREVRGGADASGAALMPQRTAVG